LAGVESDAGDLLERVKHAPVTHGLVAAILFFFAVGWLSSADDRSAARTELARSVSYFEENPFVEMTPRIMSEVGRQRAAELHEVYTQERRRLGLPLVPTRIKGMTQRRFNELQSEAHSALGRLPDARFGVKADAPSLSTFLTHPFVHAGLVSLLISVIFLMWAGTSVEMAWGSALYGAFCAGAGLLAAGMYVFAESATGAPWAGMSGVVAALMGAHTVRTAQGKTSHGFLLLPLWVVAEALGVRGFALDDPSSIAQVPVLTMGTAFAAGGCASFLWSVIGWEERHRNKQVAAPYSASDPILDAAYEARAAGRVEEAFRGFKEVLKSSSDDRDAALAFWDCAQQLRRCKDAAPAMVRVIRDHLKAGRSSDAVDRWLELVSQIPEPNVESVLIVRIAESLLDEGHPDHAIAAMKRAVGAGSKLSPVLARRVVRVARDLDPQLTRQAAQLALRDSELQPDERRDLESLSHHPLEEKPSVSPADAAPAAPSASEPEAAAGGGAPPVESASERAASEALQRAALETGLVRAEVFGQNDDEILAAPFAEDGSFLPVPDRDSPPPAPSALPPALEASPKGSESQQDPDEDTAVEALIDPQALAPEALEGSPPLVADAAAASAAAVCSEAAENPDHWNSPGIVEDLSDELSDDDLSMSEFSALVAEAEDVTEPTIEVPTPAPAAAPADPSGVDTAVELAARAGRAAAEPLSAPTAPPVRPAPRVRDAVPVRLQEDGFEVEVADHGKTVLPYERIEALTLAAVEGLSAKPVLVVDLVIAWRVPLGEAVKTIRLRGDRFDPCQVVPGQTSPLSALLTMVAEVRNRASALPIPHESALRGDPFASFADIAQYERDLLTPS